MLKRWLSPVVIACTAVSVNAQIKQSLPSRPASAIATAPVTVLTFRELLDDSGATLTPSAKTLRLQGRRVRITGFMAQMEDRSQGAFYLCARPTTCDESGNGTGDLPIDAIRIIVPWKEKDEISFVPHPIEVTGLFEFGSFTDDRGNVAAFRIVAEGRPQRPSLRRRDRGPVRSAGTSRMQFRKQ